MKIAKKIILYTLAILTLLAAIFAGLLFVAESEKSAAIDCPKDLNCWAEKHKVKVEKGCSKSIERMAKFSHQWTASLASGKRFTKYKWGDKEKYQLAAIGDEIKFQNPFGAWTYTTYTCTYNPFREDNGVVNVEIEKGRL